MKTFEEIKVKIKEEENEVLSFFIDTIIDYLPFDVAKEHLKEEYVKNIESGSEVWNQKELTRNNIIEDMKNYMEFAWGKVIDHRGLSAGRSVNKFQGWIWVLGEDDKIDWENYTNYGAPILKQICGVYGFEIPESKEVKNMMEGRMCRENCDEGCC